jgi:toxin FitB
MILLDISVVSEPFKRSGDPKVMAWIDAQMLETLYLSTITLAALCFGIAALPDDQRRETLQAGLEKRIVPLFAERILSFDDPASSAYATLRARARLRELAIAPTNGFIVAIAAARSFTVATRDTSPFIAAGVNVINPWE